jgi:hypothetical protein
MLQNATIKELLSLDPPAETNSSSSITALTTFSWPDSLTAPIARFQVLLVLEASRLGCGTWVFNKYSLTLNKLNFVAWES